MRDASDRLHYLDEVMDLLFPPSPPDARPGAQPDARPGARPRARSVLPHRLVPRRVVPRAWWHTPLGRGLPVSGGADTIETHLSDVLGRRMRVVVHVRPARRANRKPILEAYDGSGLAGFVKIGDSPRARRLVRYESEVLRMLAGQPLKVVVPPDVLYHGRWRGLEVLMLSPLPVTSLRVGSRRVPARLLTSAAREIAAIRPYDEEAGSEEQTGETAAWHGDFTPWNVAAGVDGRLLVWDWERFAVGVPPGFDALHHFFHRALRRMPPPVAARSCLAQAGGLLEPFGVDVAQARRTAAHYLVALAERHRRDGQEPLGPPAVWLNPLVDHLEFLL
ncbi:hypothetical protein [Microbispora bryophytorum]|uniref:Aminoglycoside phosphotransferase domain-containing protein n=1 Tax=Microbispora bryophytorum TaxID=1460882 RepID=A0A8H9LEX4_9ACTN|nr:hypothetical protein [Microbispora bryophytorum]MBD3136566.1 hypothetical protein [Microbispora bryophytorum]TQS06164.1 hypothetical protein FLX07_13950 [Microbispora bryophytorum]GGO18230.1 hypothetical protein GCM10011574_42720 [Microbispora bryophytorum]